VDAVIENASDLAKGRRNMMSQVNARIETETKRAADVAFACWHCAKRGYPRAVRQGGRAWKLAQVGGGFGCKR